jgi:hypothetical protein
MGSSFEDPEDEDAPRAFPSIIMHPTHLYDHHPILLIHPHTIHTADDGHSNYSHTQVHQESYYLFHNHCISNLSDLHLVRAQNTGLACEGCCYRWDGVGFWMRKFVIVYSLMHAQHEFVEVNLHCSALDWFISI